MSSPAASRHSSSLSLRRGRLPELQTEIVHYTLDPGDSLVVTLKLPPEKLRKIGENPPTNLQRTHTANPAEQSHPVPSRNPRLPSPLASLIVTLNLPPEKLRNMASLPPVRSTPQHTSDAEQCLKDLLRRALSGSTAQLGLKEAEAEAVSPEDEDEEDDPQPMLPPLTPSKDKTLVAQRLLKKTVTQPDERKSVKFEAEAEIEAAEQAKAARLAEGRRTAFERKREKRADELKSSGMSARPVNKSPRAISRLARANSGDTDVASDATEDDAALGRAQLRALEVVAVVEEDSSPPDSPPGGVSLRFTE